MVQSFGVAASGGLVQAGAMEKPITHIKKKKKKKKKKNMMRVETERI